MTACLQVIGLQRLQNVVSAAPLAYCSAFSSVAAFIGSGGQANYAAANAALDAAAATMRQAGLPGGPCSGILALPICFSSGAMMMPCRPVRPEPGGWAACMLTVCC